MTTTHTPTPWELVEATTTIPIRGANGKTVASVKYGATDFSDAAHIVRCVNSHDDLLAALQTIVQWNSRTMDSGFPAPTGMTQIQLNAARAAVLKAIGAKPCTPP